MMGLIQRVIGLGARANDLPANALLEEIGHLNLEELSPADQHMVRVALRLAVRPGSMTAAVIATLREHGFSDAEVHDVVHVVACFAYMNRVADGLGVGIEPARRALAVALYGEQRTEEHLNWSAAAR